MNDPCRHGNGWSHCLTCDGDSKSCSSHVGCLRDQLAALQDRFSQLMEAATEMAGCVVEEDGKECLQCIGCRLKTVLDEVNP